MKTIRILFTILGFGALTIGLSFAQSSGQAPEPAPSETLTRTTSDGPSGGTQDSPAQDKGKRTDGKQSNGQQDGNHASDKSGQPSANEGHGAQTSGKGKSTDGNHPDAKQGGHPAADQGGPANAKKATPSLHSSQDHVKQAPSNREASGEKRASIGQTGSTSGNAADRHQAGLGQSGGAPKDGLRTSTIEKQRSPPPVSPSPGQFTALPVNPAYKRGPAPAAIGGLPTSSGARNTAVISGTGMKRKP